MSGQTLAVDTDAIRRAADVVEQAAVGFDGVGRDDSSPLTDGSLGSTDAARDVVTAAGQGLARAHDAARGLAGRTRTVAGAMRTAATTFDLAESTIGAFR